MVHICNDCQYKEGCKNFLEDKTGILCNNKYYQLEREKQWAENCKEFNDLLEK